MFKLWATIQKDLRILTRDKVGLTLMFVMPILLAIVITAIQNSTFELVNDNKVPLLLCNRDTGSASKQLIMAIEKVGMFDVKQVTGNETEAQITARMHAKDALVAIVIPAHFSATLAAKASAISSNALREFGVAADSNKAGVTGIEPVNLYYHPVLQLSFRSSIQGALRSALQIVENKQLLQKLYYSLNEKELPASFENQLMNNQATINEVAISRDGSRNIPNATQHNIPAWTIFAMFFIVISLGASVVREKLNGSFLRLKTLPTSYLLALLSKQITYLAVTLLQTVVIFSIGVWLFPRMGLPALNIPADKAGLLVVAVICGWCAVSYAICIGVFAQTQEQANGFGAVSIVLLAAIGGILVPSFAMPASFQGIMKISPLHWCLEAFYGLFLEGGSLKDVLLNILPLLAITLLIQAITFYTLKRKNLI
ncbi:MAG TPA: ABC transporter permease [Chitinophagaceae bacterium]|nr:ABC transporter permease [Chitinophagaceae bacterium]